LENVDNRYKYAKQCFGTSADKYDENWCGIIEDERKVYFALSHYNECGEENYNKRGSVCRT
jgi:hypothetical protein